MKRQDVYNQITEMFGLVPGMFKELPDSTLELEWQLMKRSQFDEGPIPNKYRELIGVALSAITKCKYCAFIQNWQNLTVQQPKKLKMLYIMLNQVLDGVLTSMECNSTLKSSRVKYCKLVNTFAHFKNKS